MHFCEMAGSASHSASTLAETKLESNLHRNCIITDVLRFVSFACRCIKFISRLGLVILEYLCIKHDFVGMCLRRLLSSAFAILPVTAFGILRANEAFRSAQMCDVWFRFSKLLSTYLSASL